MEIKKPDTEELKQLVKIYKEFFPVHAIFTKSEEDVLNYLETFLEGDIFVAVKDNEVVGGLVIAWKEYGHTVAYLKHIAAKNADKEVIKELVQEAEKTGKSGKIEIHIAEGEKIPCNFYEELGYEVEGKLKSHYRKDETCYILGKVIG